MILRNSFLKDYTGLTNYDKEQELIRKKYDADQYDYENNRHMKEKDIYKKVVKSSLGKFINNIMKSEDHNKLLYRSAHKRQLNFEKRSLNMIKTIQKVKSPSEQVYNKTSSKRRSVVSLIHVESEEDDEKIKKLRNLIKDEKNPQHIFRQMRIKEIVKTLRNEYSVFQESEQERKNFILNKVELKHNESLEQKEIEKKLKQDRAHQISLDKHRRFENLIPKFIKGELELNDAELNPSSTYSKLYHNYIQHSAVRSQKITKDYLNRSTASAFSSVDLHVGLINPDNSGKEFTTKVTQSMKKRSIKHYSLGPLDDQNDDNGNEPKRVEPKNLKLDLKARVNTYKCYSFKDYEDCNKNNLLHIAVKNQNHKLVKQLLNAGFNPNKQNIDGNTPGHLAASNKDFDCLTLLLNAGGSIQIKNAKGFVAKDFLNVSKF